MPRHVFRSIWRDACSAPKVEAIGVGLLRHTGCSIGYLATKDMQAVSERLGQTSTQMMDAVYAKTYSHASRHVADSIDAVVEAGRSAPRSAPLTGS